LPVEGSETVDIVDVDLDVAEHFAGKGENVRAIYDALILGLEAVGPVTVEPKKTCLHIVNRTALAGVYPKREVLQLEFKTDHPIDDSLIVKSEQMSRNRWHHVVRLKCAADLDGKVSGWIREAYLLSA
jgi:hypothetical protein